MQQPMTTELLCTHVTDHVGLPDFSYGAMENWGLITYLDAYLLYDEEQVGVTGKQDTVSIVAHEQAHNVGDRNQLTY